MARFSDFQRRAERRVSRFDDELKEAIRALWHLHGATGQLKSGATVKRSVTALKPLLETLVRDLAADVRVLTAKGQQQLGWDYAKTLVVQASLRAPQLCLLDRQSWLSPSARAAADSLFRKAQEDAVALLSELRVGFDHPVPQDGGGLEGVFRRNSGILTAVGVIASILALVLAALALPQLG
jgi:hypothetical protein